MIKLLTILSVVLFLAGCSKNDDVTLDAGDAVAGIHAVSKFTFDGPGTAGDYPYDMPVTNVGLTLSGVFVATRKTENTVGMIFTLKVTGSPDDPTGFGDVEVRTNGGNYDLYSGSVKIGTVS